MQVLAILVENEPGALTRVASVFGRRGFNIDSVAVGACQDPRLARMTIRVSADSAGAERLRRHLDRLVNVIRTQVLPEDNMVSRELAMIKVSAESHQRSDILQVAEIFRASIIDVGSSTVIVEVTGDEGKITAILEVLNEYGIIEVVRTGEAALTRGKESLADNSCAPARVKILKAPAD